jgi:hypothetical protein
MVAEKSSVCRRAGIAAMIVEHQQLDAAQVGVLLAQVVDEAPRRGDDDVDAGP